MIRILSLFTRMLCEPEHRDGNPKACVIKSVFLKEPCSLHLRDTAAVVSRNLNEEKRANNKI